MCEYTSKEDIERVVQEECEARFTLAHNAPIMKHSLAGKLRYLEDEDVARAIVGGTYEIPPEVDEATKSILQEIGDMGGGKPDVATDTISPLPPRIFRRSGRQ